MTTPIYPERPWLSRMPPWVREIPTLVVVIWAIAMTVLVVHNYNSINATSKARDQVLCAADNTTRSLAAQILAVGASGTDPAAARWQTLQLRLEGELIAANCAP